MDTLLAVAPEYSQVAGNMRAADEADVLLVVDQVVRAIAIDIGDFNPDTVCSIAESSTV